MSNSKRAIRRHHRERLNRRTAFVLTKVQYWWNPQDDDLKYYVNRRRDNMQMCSCYACCNGRRQLNDRLPVKELRKNDDFFDQILEYEEMYNL